MIKKYNGDKLDRYLCEIYCETDYAIYRNEYKQKNYEGALKTWRKVFFNCPDYNQTMFFYIILYI